MLTLNDYQAKALKTAVYPGQGSPMGLIYTALKGAGEAGEFAEHVGKAIRDDGLVDMVAYDTVMFRNLSVERHEKLVKELGDQLWYVAAKARELGVTLEDVALINIEKLTDRNARGVLQGSGDSR